MTNMRSLIFRFRAWSVMSDRVLQRSIVVFMTYCINQASRAFFIITLLRWSSECAPSFFFSLELPKYDQCLCCKACTRSIFVMILLWQKCSEDISPKQDGRVKYKYSLHSGSDIMNETYYNKACTPTTSLFS